MLRVGEKPERHGLDLDQIVAFLGKQKIPELQRDSQLPGVPLGNPPVQADSVDKVADNFDVYYLEVTAGGCQSRKQARLLAGRAQVPAGDVAIGEPSPEALLAKIGKDFADQTVARFSRF